MSRFQITLTDENIDRVVAMCKRLVETHATGDIETLLFGVECLGQMAKQQPRQPHGVITCKGCFAFGSACQGCSKCLTEVLDKMESKT